jgi:hypothetical protein
MSKSAEQLPMVGGNPPAFTVDVKVVENNVRSILKAYELSGFNSSGFKLQPTIDHHVKCCQEVGILTFYKYKMAAVVAYYLKQQLPAKPVKLGEDKAEVLLGGKAMKWLELQNRKNEGVVRPSKFDSIIHTLMTVKRAMERPSDDDVKKAVKETFSALTAPRKNHIDSESLLWSDITDQEEENQEFNDLLQEVERTTLEIFRGKSYTWKDSVRPFFPSTNANYLTTRSAGGAVGYIMENFQSLLKSKSELVKWNEEGKGKYVHTVVDDSALMAKWQQLYEYLIEEAGVEEKSVKLVGLKEAVKVRVISKGPVATYTVLKPLQQWMWNTIRKHDSGAFRLVGEEISSRYMEEQLGVLREDEDLLSGDYKAATDNMNPLLSQKVVEIISNQCIADKRIAKLLLESLTGHMIEDPEDASRRLAQTWGQLMGSIVSFPVLCIINAAICRRSREEGQGHTLSLKNAKIAINGDDCAFRATLQMRKKWERLAHISGMTPSIGKTFFSREFVNMNSMQFAVVPQTCDRKLINGNRPVVRYLAQIPKINMGLLSGKGRSTSGKMDAVTVADWGTLNSVSQNAHTLLHECWPEDREIVLKAYINYNWELLTKTSLPWFLPEHLGGLGLPIVGEFKPTAKDLRLASAFYAHGKLPAKRPEGVSWNTWKYAQDRIKAKPLQMASTLNAMYEFQTSSSKEDEWGLSTLQNLEAKLCVEAIFRLDFKTIHTEKQQRNLTLRNIERAVKNVMKHMKSVEKFEEGSLPKSELKEKLPMIHLASSPLFQATNMALTTLFSE